jgi:molybdenum cofactor cytidylyltransferase
LVLFEECRLEETREGRPVAGVLLAAGASSRMGSNKLFLSLDGESLVRRALRSAREAQLDPVVVVLGSEADRVRAELADPACAFVVNPDPARGIHTSLAAGIAALPPDAEAVVVLLADMPFVTGRMIGTLIETYRKSRAKIVTSEYGDAQAPPTLYGRGLFGELLAADRGCGKSVLARYAGEIERVHWSAAALADLDRPEDYERARAELEARKAECAPIS